MNKASVTARYPKPGDSGGRLLREIVGFFKQNEISLPISSHILCAISGGSDSLALGVALARYGRRVGNPAQIVWLHVNHGWRGAESDRDEAWVKKLAKKYGVGFESIRATTQPSPGDSWEAHARGLRKNAFMLLSKKYRTPWIFTGHTADDLAETKLWRIFNGQWDTHGEGIYAVHAYGGVQEVRPFLGLRKEFLREFLREEKVKWREDATNYEGRFLRSKIRMELMPVLEKIFPHAVTHLNRLK